MVNWSRVQGHGDKTQANDEPEYTFEMFKILNINIDSSPCNK